MPHLSGRVFPSTASTRTWLTDAADLPPLLRGDRATVSEHGVPVLDTSDVNDRKRLSDKISDHKRRLEQRRIDEERRLLYVAITRAEDTLLLSGHHWGAAETKPRGPSEFLCELKDIIETSAAAGDPCGVVEHWAPAPGRRRAESVAGQGGRSGLARRPGGRRAAATWTAAPRWWRRRCRASSAGDARRCRRAGRPTSTPCWPNGSRAAEPARAGAARPAVGQHAGGARPRPRRGGAAAAPAAADPPRSACPAGHRVSRLGAAVLPRRAAVRPRRPARRGRLATRRAPTRTAWPSCRPRSRCRRGPPAPRSTSRCRSTW